MTTNEAIKAAAAGQDSPVEIYWDTQDPSNPGAAYRYTDGSDSGACEFVEWSNGEQEYGGIYVGEYFDGEGRYQGPDSEGVYPVFAE